MNIFKKLLLLGLMFFIGGIVMQALGYIDSPLFAWFTKVELYEL